MVKGGWFDRHRRTSSSARRAFSFYTDSYGRGGADSVLTPVVSYAINWIWVANVPVNRANAWERSPVTAGYGRAGASSAVAHSLERWLAGLAG